LLLFLQVDLLGKSLAIWADSKGAWHCAEDRCPHRMARLSEGRVERGNIQVRKRKEGKQPQAVLRSAIARVSWCQMDHVQARFPDGPLT
jgi:hypothetical protein